MITLFDYDEEELSVLIQSTKVFQSKLNKHTDEYLYNFGIDFEVVDGALNELGIECDSEDEDLDEDYFQIRGNLYSIIRFALASDEPDYIPLFLLKAYTNDEIRALINKHNKNVG